MADKFQITIEIAGRRFKIPVNRENEEVYRKAAKLVNEQVAYYSRKPDAEELDVLAMAAFRVALAYISAVNESSRDSAALADICKNIEDSLHSVV
ncbi:MAG: cell division protein ZapA [Bacteroidales bacterium]